MEALAARAGTYQNFCQEPTRGRPFTEKQMQRGIKVYQALKKAEKKRNRKIPEEKMRQILHRAMKKPPALGKPSDLSDDFVFDDLFDDDDDAGADNQREKSPLGRGIEVEGKPLLIKDPADNTTWARNTRWGKILEGDAVEYRGYFDMEY